MAQRLGGVVTEPDVLAQLLEYTRSRYFGKYRGTVVDNKDSTKRGRLKVAVPAVLGDLEVWAMPCVPYAGDSVGLFSMPAAKSGVWVEFEAGDPSFPIWVGCFWADNETPESGDPDIKTWVTKSCVVRLDDKNDAVKVNNGNSVSIELTAEAVTKAGDTVSHTVSKSTVMSDAGHGKVEVASSSVKVNGGALEVS